MINNTMAIISKMWINPPAIWKRKPRTQRTIRIEAIDSRIPMM